MGGEIGYTHALFAANSYFRQIALDVDKEENGGNNNGLIDNGEIQEFKKRVKEKYNFDFSFNNISQSELKNIKFKGENRWGQIACIWDTCTELSEHYANNGTSSKTIFALNKNKGEDINEMKDLFAPTKYKQDTIDISYMEEEDFHKSQEEVERQEAILRKQLEEK